MTKRTVPIFPGNIRERARMRRAAEELYRAAGVPVETSFFTKRIERTLTPRGQVARIRKPRSVYDKLRSEVRPFGWSSPAPRLDGTTPLPWRTANREGAERLVRQGSRFPEFYVIHGDEIDGHLVLDIGYRGKTDAREWLTVAAQGLRSAGFRVRFGEKDHWVHLVDDLPRYVLRGRRSEFEKWKKMFG